MSKTFTKLLVFSTVFFSVQSFAQFDPYYTHYMLNKLAFNPAVAGEKDAICVNALTHQQWMRQRDQSALYKSRLDGSGPIEFSGVNPSTNTFSITAPVINNQLGLGLQAITDNVGFINTTYLRGSLAWKFRMGRKLPDGSTDQTLAIGADFGMMQVKMDGTKYYALDPDPLVPSTVVDGNTFDAGAGVYYTHERLFDGFYAGASVTHLTEPVVNVGGVSDWATGRTLYLLAGSRHNMGVFSLLPSALVKVGGTLQVDLGARAMFNDKFVAGANLRSKDALSVLLGYYFLPNLYVGYSYDFNIFSGVFQYTSAGTHELFLSYCFDISTPPPTPPKPRYNVRYLEGFTIY